MPRCQLTAESTCSGEAPTHLLGILVDHADRTPRQDVVELAKQHVLPQRVDLVLRVRIRLAALRLGVEDGRKGCGELEVVEKNFGLAVVALD